MVVVGKPRSLFLGSIRKGYGLQRLQGRSDGSWHSSFIFFPAGCPTEMLSGSFPGRCLGACVRPVAVPWCDTLKRAPGPINSCRHT